LTRDAHGEEVVRFDVNLNATIEITKLEWESYLETTHDETDALMELGQVIDGSEFPIPDGRVWITSVDDPTILEGG
jgi:hypothetical protein